jgi:hypothetical protein
LRLGEIGTFQLFKKMKFFADAGFELQGCRFAPKPVGTRVFE